MTQRFTYYGHTVWHVDTPTSLCLLSCIDSAKCHILGYGDPGWRLWPPNLNSGKTFVQCNHQVSSSYV